MTSIRSRHGRILAGAVGALVGMLVTVVPEPALAGARGLRAAHGLHAPAARLHRAHGVEVWKGCASEAVPPRRLHARPVAHRPLRGVPDPAPRHGLHGTPLVIFVDGGPEVVIDQPGVVIIVE